jgi:hypothetical protein
LLDTRNATGDETAVSPLLLLENSVSRAVGLRMLYTRARHHGNRLGKLDLSLFP